MLNVQRNFAGNVISREALEIMGVESGTGMGGKGIVARRKIRMDRPRVATPTAVRSAALKVPTIIENAVARSAIRR